jgi:hypothetical protein
MIYPKKNALVLWVFNLYVKRWLVPRHFNKLVFNDIDINPNRSILLVANHFSFWDGLILYCLNEKLFKKKFYVMMLRDTADRISILKYAGAFSVTKNTREMIISLDYAAGLLHDPHNLVLMFPQGKLYSNFVAGIKFQRGIMRIIKKAAGKFDLVFASTFIQYLKHEKPTATVYFKSEHANYADKDIADLQNSYQQHYDACKLQQTEIEL